MKNILIYQNNKSLKLKFPVVFSNKKFPSLFNYKKN